MKKSFTECTEDAIRDRYRSERETAKKLQPLSAPITVILWSAEFEFSPCGGLAIKKYLKMTKYKKLAPQSFFLRGDYPSYVALTYDLLSRGGILEHITMREWKLVVSVTCGSRPSVVDTARHLEEIKTPFDAIMATCGKTPTGRNKVPGYVLNFIQEQEVEIVPGSDRDEDGRRAVPIYRPARISHGSVTEAEALHRVKAEEVPAGTSMINTEPDRKTSISARSTRRQVKLEGARTVKLEGARIAKLESACTAKAEVDVTREEQSIARPESPAPTTTVQVQRAVTTEPDTVVQGEVIVVQVSSFISYTYLVYD